jgi:hypothetical protein
LEFWSPSPEQYGYATGGLLLWASLVSFAIRTSPSIITSALLSIVYGGLVAAAALLDSSSVPADRPVLLLAGFSIGFLLFWVRFVTKQRFHLRWPGSLTLDVVSVLVLTVSVGYVVANMTFYNRAPRDFAKGVIQSRQRFADAAMFKTAFDAHPMLSHSILQEGYGYGLPKEERKSPANDADAAAVIMKHLGQALSSDILIASNESVIVLFEANNELIRALSKMGYLQCDALLNGKLSAEALVTYVGREKVEAAASGWQDVVNTGKTHVGAPFDVKGWQSIASSSLSAKANAEIDQLTGSAEKKN